MFGCHLQTPGILAQVGTQTHTCKHMHTFSYTLSTLAAAACQSLGSSLCERSELIITLNAKDQNPISRKVGSAELNKASSKSSLPFSSLHTQTHTHTNMSCDIKEYE